MTWRVVIPIKQPGARKSRLAGTLSEVERETLAQRMFDHVTAVVTPMAGVLPLVLSPERPAGWSGGWIADRTGVNAMLEDLRSAEPERGFAVINADLPLLEQGEVSALLAAAARDGMAIAPDRAGTGTNAVALAPHRLARFCFGPGSCAAFRAASAGPVAIVDQPGLALDIDCAEDLAALAAQASC